MKLSKLQYFIDTISYYLIYYYSNYTIAILLKWILTLGPAFLPPRIPARKAYRFRPGFGQPETAVRVPAVWSSSVDEVLAPGQQRTASRPARRQTNWSDVACWPLDASSDHVALDRTRLQRSLTLQIDPNERGKKRQTLVKFSSSISSLWQRAHSLARALDQALEPKRRPEGGRRAAGVCVAEFHRLGWINI